MAPMLAMTAGLHGSASTWVFNVARELAIAAFGAEQVFAHYLEYPADVPREALRTGHYLLVKSHHGSLALDQWMAERDARIIVSIRDPRDAALSMMRRFRSPAAQAAAWIVGDCDRAARLIAAGYPWLRYEDRFFDDPGSVGRVASWLGLTTPDPVNRTIFARYRTETLRQTTSTADAPRVDPVTQIWTDHIGSAASGQWRLMSVRDRETFSRVLGPFTRNFGYQEQ